MSNSDLPDVAGNDDSLWQSDSFDSSLAIITQPVHAGDIPPSPLAYEISFIPDLRKEGRLEPDVPPVPLSLDIQFIPDKKKEGNLEPDVAPSSSHQAILFEPDTRR